MCGIVGYAGPGPAQNFLLDGLERLEYRGYDSAGLAVVDADGIRRTRTTGRVEDLRARTDLSPLRGHTGIGHTRWATHGEPSVPNAHPHVDCTGLFAIVHNGILENYRRLREELIRRGHRFASGTDTEVAVHLLEELYAGDLTQAVEAMAQRLEGSYAICAVTAYEPARVVAVRQGNPLVVGLGQGENYLASDLTAMLGRTRDGVALEDGDMAIVTADRVDVFGTGRQPKPVRPFRVTWSPTQAERGGYPHFMLKEILEQPTAIRATLLGRIQGPGAVADAVRDTGAAKATETSSPGGVGAGPAVWLQELDGIDLGAIDRMRLVACGTSYHAARVGEILLERLAGVEARAELASEFRYRRPVLGGTEPVLFVSQSGETFDTLEAMREVKRLGHPTWAVTNVLGSSLEREANVTLLTQAGPEISVASTKAFTTQLLVLTLLAIAIGERRGTLDAARARDLVEDLRRLPDEAEAVLAGAREAARTMGHRLATARDAYFLGRDLDLPVAMEGALKLKEISYVHAEAQAAGEMKHGPLALLEAGVPLVAVMTQAQVAAKTAANVTEGTTRGAVAIGVIRRDLDDERGFETERTFRIPAGSDETRPVLAVLPLQLLAYETAVARGTDVDRPRNLAKSVTVE